MIEHLRQKYLEEAHDLLLELEKTLLQLEEDPADREGVETAFRVMHTLKGSSGMFGYQQIGELVHLLEGGYDAIRSLEQPLPQGLLNISLESIDHIRSLLAQQGEEENAGMEAQHKGLLKRAAEMLYELLPAEDGASAVCQTKVAAGQNTWAILFAPHPSILRNGTNPLYLLEELHELGQLHSFPIGHRLPSLETLEPQSCWFSWLLLLATEAAEASIRETFMFVEDSCHLEIAHLAAGNLLVQQSEAVEAIIQPAVAAGLGPEAFSRLVEELRSTGARGSQAMHPEGFLLASGAHQEQERVLLGHKKERGAASIRVASDKLDDLMNLVSELVANQERLSLLAELSVAPELASVAEEIEKITRQLRDKTFDICLVPIGSLLTRFKRLVRDLSQELGKKIQFEAEGMETELDKNVVESLSDCLVHIFRNSLDHGIEAEEQRIRKGKAAQGKLTLRAYNSGTRVVIEVQDDGAGIDHQAVRQKAVAKGLISSEQKLTEQESLELLFMPGFSTAQGVTAVSGRGVGMDVVRKKMKELRGEVSIRSQKGIGTTLALSLPLTISIIDGLLVRVADTDFVLPLSFVEKSYSVTPADLNRAINNQLILDGEPVIYFNLADAFAFGQLSQTAFAVVIQVGQTQVALLVDEIIGEYQAVLKPLGKFYQEQDFLSGGSLKGDGTVALVIDPQKLIQDIMQNTVQEI